MQTYRNAVLAFLGGLITLSLTGDAASATSLSSQRVQIGTVPAIPNGVVTPPKIVAYTQPLYTDEARQLAIEGTVVVQAEFDIQGNFKVLKVIEGLGYGLDENALASLKGWRFVPAYRNGARVSVIAQIDIPFRLSDTDLYLGAMEELDRSDYVAVRPLLQKLISIHPDSQYLPQAKYALGESFYREGTRVALTQAQWEFRDYLTLFPNTPLANEASSKLVLIQQQLGALVNEQ